MENMNKGITSSKFNKGPKACKLKRDKVPVIPFLSLSSGGGSRRRKGQKEHLGEVRAEEGTRKTSWRPPPQEADDDDDGRRAGRQGGKADNTRRRRRCPRTPSR